MENELSVKPMIEESWKLALQKEFQSDYFLSLKRFLVEEKKMHRIFPPGQFIFSAFKHTPFEQVKAVILGQDPYHGPGQAHGLCFSVNRGIEQPPSLVNIFKNLIAIWVSPYRSTAIWKPGQNKVCYCSMRP